MEYPGKAKRSEPPKPPSEINLFWFFLESIFPIIIGVILALHLGYIGSQPKQLVGVTQATDTRVHDYQLELRAEKATEISLAFADHDVFVISDGNEASSLVAHEATVPLDYNEKSYFVAQTRLFLTNQGRIVLTITGASPTFELDSKDPITLVIRPHEQGYEALRRVAVGIGVFIWVMLSGLMMGLHEIIKKLKKLSSA